MCLIWDTTQPLFIALVFREAWTLFIYHWENIDSVSRGCWRFLLLITGETDCICTPAFYSHLEIYHFRWWWCQNGLSREDSRSSAEVKLHLSKQPLQQQPERNCFYVSPFPRDPEREEGRDEEKLSAVERERAASCHAVKYGELGAGQPLSVSFRGNNESPFSVAHSRSRLYKSKAAAPTSVVVYCIYTFNTLKGIRHAKMKTCSSAGHPRLGWVCFLIRFGEM